MNPQGGVEKFIKRDDIPYLGPFQAIDGRADLLVLSKEEKANEDNIYNFINN